MKRFIKHFLLFLMICSMSSCIRNEVELSPWSTDPMPVILSVISPDHPVVLYLGKSYFKKDTTNKIPYPEARIFMCGRDSVWTELTLQSSDTSRYIDKDNLIRVVKGNTYSLRIELKDITLHAQTTVPIDGATLIDASCTFPPDDGTDNNYSSIVIDGKYYHAKDGFLSVKFNLPKNNAYGCYLSAFSQELGNGSTLNGIDYYQQNFLYPLNYSPTNINLITTDPHLKKFRLSEMINYNQSLDSDLLSVITSAFGGVLPDFSNIENGLGLFGSFSSDSKLIEVIQLTQ